MCEHCQGKGTVLTRVYVTEKIGRNVVSYYTFRSGKCKCSDISIDVKHMQAALAQQEGLDISV